MYEDRKRCLDAGMNDYISKPMRIEELSKALHRLKGRLPSRDESGDGQRGTADAPGTGAGDEPQGPVNPAALQEFADLMGDDSQAMISELIRLYLEGTPRLMDELRHGLKSGDTGGIQHAVHTLRSGSAQIGAGALAAMAAELDDLCYQNDLPAIAARAGAFLAEYEQVMVYFKTEYGRRIPVGYSLPCRDRMVA